MAIEPMNELDWPQVATIYREGIASGIATFETEVPGWETWDASHLEECRLVARNSGLVVGWAALSPVSDRCAYGGVAEVSVYVAEAVRGRGLGSKLLAQLVTASEDAGLWTLQAGIFSENIASIRIHQACGFRIIGVRERLGQLAGEWRDVAMLERRSSKTGL